MEPPLKGQSQRARLEFVNEFDLHVPSGTSDKNVGRHCFPKFERLVLDLRGKSRMF